ncbi:beta-glucosidase BglX [Sporolactobacillus spathodeae]|uniref:beta-glucosidase n=1 Tax=Sporolactobacillus spathodeae TaxID=1465502 RepID=A0ABS2Q7U4_9BACL|nr:beta-glucosidase BglX [Sporolactobacillus spathodeae]MBM7657721.1 beta-glucosidase [Sporolactobacillus spathodeae]
MKESELTTLLHTMTLEEKIGQLVQLSSNFYSDAEGALTGPMAQMGVTEKLVADSGSTLGASGARQIIDLQKRHLEASRLQIPLLVMADVVHGYKTIFPIPLAIGCSWHPELAEEAARIAAREAAVSGVHVVFAPMVDLVRDPRWGRVMESTGEDAFLNSVFARAFVQGFQGNDLKNDRDRVAACVKHFAAYGAAEGGREYNTTDLSEWRMREEYLPAYKAAVDAGCKMIMTSFNTIKGVPSSANRWLLRQVLRNEWAFDGTIISDWGAVRELLAHGVAEDEQEAAEKAIKAGVDIEMMTLCYPHALENLVADGRIPVSLIDQAVFRILNLKNDLGLFESPYRGVDEEKEKEIVYCAAHREQARKLAEESCVLLKNNGILPLQGHAKIALIGPFADSGDLLGSWSWKGEPRDTQTLKQAFLKDASFDTFFAKGSGITQTNSHFLEEAVVAAKQSDVVILAVGESSAMSGEASSRTRITLPDCQQKLFAALKATGRPIVTLLFNGRPLELGSLAEQTDALLEAWFPGSEGAEAIVNLLTGKTNPSGKLTMSFPRTVGQIPVYYNSFNTGRPLAENPQEPKYVSKYIDCPNEPLFAFGYGLSYTQFMYENLKLSASRLMEDEQLIVTVTVANVGDRPGADVVQLYLRDVAAETVRPIKELKGFKKIFLKPGARAEVSFTINEPMLRYVHSDLSSRSDSGRFEIGVGDSSARTLNAAFDFVKKDGVPR